MLLWWIVAAEKRKVVIFFFSFFNVLPAGRSDCPLGDWRRLALLRRRGWSLALLRRWSWGLALGLRLGLRFVLDGLGLWFILGLRLGLFGGLLGDCCLALGHVPLVFLLLIALLVLESHLLVFRLHLRRFNRPASAQHLGHLADARVRIVDAYAGTVVVGVPHESVDTSFGRVWILFGSHPLPLSGIWGHLVLMLFFGEPSLVFSCHGVVLCPHLEWGVLEQYCQSKISDLSDQHPTSGSASAHRLPSSLPI